MAKTDNPFKRLLTHTRQEFASWLLNEPVQRVETRNIELPADLDPIDADQVFVSILRDGRELLQHVELQGPGGHKPMPLRELDYLNRLYQVNRLGLLDSSVLYIGKGTGKDDPGKYEIFNHRGELTLAWHYRVILLWDMDAEELLNQPYIAPLAFIGQTRISNPEFIIPRVIARIKTIRNPETRKQITTGLLALTDEEEVAAVIEHLIKREGLELDTGYLRKLRREGREEGFELGRAEGQEELVLRLLTRRFGVLPEPLVAQIQALSYDRMGDLAEALLDFTSVEELSDWLSHLDT